MLSNGDYGVSFFGFLTILFVAFKLANIIEWSWLWVLGPVWIPLASILTIGLAWIVLALITLIVAVIYCLLFE